jgi:hypothetical protein
MEEPNEIQAWWVGSESGDHPLRPLTTAEINALRNSQRYVNEWELPHGYVAPRNSKISYTGRDGGNPHRTANILGTTRDIINWIYIEEPGVSGRIIGVPVLRNMENNGGLDTGRWENVRTAMGGTAAQRFSILTIPATSITNTSTTTMRTVLRATMEAAMGDITREISHFGMINGGAAGNRIPPSIRSVNHPNGVAIDINADANWGVDHDRNQRRLRPGINAMEPYLISTDVEHILNRHGWKVGYRWVAPVVEGFFHWSVDGR